MGYFRDNRIRIVEFNVENLFILLDHYDPHAGIDFSSLSEEQWRRLSSSTTPNKPIAQVRRLANIVRDLNPDIMMLSEVGGRESLAHFSRFFLGDEYVPHLIEGNSDRGIDLGYLVRRRLPFTYDLISHKHRSIDFLYPHERQSKESGYGHLRSARKQSHRFSRDVLELRVFDDASGMPAVVFLQVHLKSQLDRDRIDPQGRDRRRAELEKLIKIHKEIVDEFEGKVPVLLAGDFNGQAALPAPDPEFEGLYRDTTLKDCLEIAGVARDERFTYMQIYGNRQGYNRQLDYIFVPPELAKRVNHHDTWVFRFKDEMGMTMLIPRNLNEKKLLPSDHYPVVLTLDAVSETP
jgi:endonuclease/exonuclease/phosphatase family metal-dependent hydrolase